MNDFTAEVLYEDNHLLALNKPAGLLTMGDDTGDRTMVDVARGYLREKYNKPGNVFVGVVHRLDRPVSGVLLFARTSKAAGRLSDQLRKGDIEKTYRVLVEGRPPAAEQGELEDWLKKNRQTNKVSTASQRDAEAKHSRLIYRVVDRVGELLELEVQPVTGRSHQIRVQLASRGMPVVGDVKYGSRHRLGQSIRLHALRLQISHPTRKDRVAIECPCPFNVRNPQL